MIPRFIPYRPPAGGGGSHNATVTAWMNQVISNGGSVSVGRRTALDTLFNSGVTNGWLALLDYMVILAAENTQSALLDFIQLKLGVPNGAPTFTTDRGYTFSGTNYINSSFNAATMAIHMTQNAASIGVWDRTATASGNSVQFGAEFSTNGSGLMLSDGSGNGFYQVNAPGVGNFAAGTATGFNLAVRIAGTNASFYRNGTSLNNDTSTVSNAIQNSNFAIGADFTAGGPSLQCTDQLAIACAGGNMTSVQAAFNTDLHTYATTVGF